MARLSMAWIALLRLAFVVLALTSLGGASKVHARLTTPAPAVGTHEGASSSGSSQSSEGDEDDQGDEDDGDEDDSGE